MVIPTNKNISNVRLKNRRAVNKNMHIPPLHKLAQEKGLKKSE